MLKFSYHNHTFYSDGHDTPEAMAKAAFDAGLSYFAFTDHIHSDLFPSWTLQIKDFPQYAAHIGRVKEEYAGKMTIFTGIEADWYKGRGTHFSHYQEISPSLDFTVGSIHVLSPGGVDYLIDDDMPTYAACLNKGYGGDAKAMITDYYEGYLEMICDFKPDLLGHIDIMQKNNPESRFFDESEPWCVRLQETLAKEIAKRNLVTEVNGGGAYRYGNGVTYPSEQFLSILREADVRLTIGLDAHSVDMVTSYYDASLGYLKKAGFSELWYYDGAQWKSQPLEAVE